MKNIFLFFVVWSSCFPVAAQKKNGYVYLELPKNLLVTVSINNRLLKNVEKGYFIIPGKDLQSGTNTLTVDFENHQYKRQTFTIFNTVESQGLKLSRIANN